MTRLLHTTALLTAMACSAVACTEADLAPERPPRSEADRPGTAPACPGVTIVDHEGDRVPELLLALLGPEARGAQLSVHFGSNPDVHLGGRRVRGLRWSLDRADGPGHWDLERSRARALELAPDAEAEVDTSLPFGEVLSVDLGVRSEGQLGFEQIRRNFGSDTAWLECAAPGRSRWTLTVRRAVELGLFPARVPPAALDALAPELPVVALAVQPRSVTVGFGPGSGFDAPRVLAALRSAGFNDVESSRAGVDALRGSTSVEAEVARDGESLRFILPTVGEMAEADDDSIDSAPEPSP